MIVFRTDSSLLIGSGHVMRCLTLADELSRRGGEVMFICREHAGHLIGLIEGKGYTVARLLRPEGECAATPEDVAHQSWLGVSWQEDAADTIAALGGMRPQWLIVDHYALDCRWEETLRLHTGKILVIDDLADRLHECDMLLDQNLYRAIEARYDGLVPVRCQRLLGPKYALLRPEFAVARKDLRERFGEIRRVLVFFGGVDPTNETEKALQALKGMTGRQFEVDVVVGAANLNSERIQQICAANRGFHYRCQVNNVAELMAMADLAVGAGGTATWERCAMGLPSLVMSVADNQVELAETGAEHGLFLYLGKARDVSSDVIMKALELFFASPVNLRHYAASSVGLVDAKGAGRVAAFLAPLPISLRRVIPEDCDAIYAWRNDEETRRYIFNSEPITIEAHRRWFFSSLENMDRILLIGEINGKPVGVLRYDLSGDEALVSVYLVPGEGGHGVGSQLIRCGTQYMRRNHPRIKAVNAEIFRENIASLRAFESAGYKEHHLIFKEALA